MTSQPPGIRGMSVQSRLGRDDQIGKPTAIVRPQDEADADQFGDNGPVPLDTPSRRLSRRSRAPIGKFEVVEAANQFGLGRLGCGRDGDFVAMRDPSQHEPSSADYDGDIGALSGTEAGGQVANKRETVGGALEPRGTCSAGSETGGGRIRHPAEKCAQNPRSGIEFGGFGGAEGLRVPEREPRAESLRQSDDQKAEDRHDYKQFQQCEPGLSAELVQVRRIRLHAPLTAAHSREVLSTAASGTRVATSTLQRVMLTAVTRSGASDLDAADLAASKCFLYYRLRLLAGPRDGNIANCVSSTGASGGTIRGSGT